MTIIIIMGWLQNGNKLNNRINNFNFFHRPSDYALLYSQNYGSIFSTSVMVGFNDIVNFTKVKELNNSVIETKSVDL